MMIKTKKERYDMPIEEMNAIVSKWKMHIPFRCRFPSESQVSLKDKTTLGPGPDDHIGMIIDVSYNKHIEFRVLCPKLLEVSPNYDRHNPSDENVRIIPPSQRQLHVLSGFQFMMCCYYNWDINMNLKMNVPYIRDFCIGVQLEMQPGQWKSMKEIFPQSIRDGEGLKEWLQSNQLPKPDKSFSLETYNRYQLTHVPKLYGRNQGGIHQSKRTSVNQFRPKTTRTNQPVDRNSKKIGLGGVRGVRPLAQFCESKIIESNDDDIFVGDKKSKRKSAAAAGDGGLVVHPIHPFGSSASSASSSLGDSSSQVPLVVKPLIISGLEQDPGGGGKKTRDGKGTRGGKGASPRTRTRARGGKGTTDSSSPKEFQMINFESDVSQLFGPTEPAYTEEPSTAQRAKGSKKQKKNQSQLNAPVLILAPGDPSVMLQSPIGSLAYPFHQPIVMTNTPTFVDQQSTNQPLFYLSAEPHSTGGIGAPGATTLPDEDSHLFDSLDDFNNHENFDNQQFLPDFFTTLPSAILSSLFSEPPAQPSSLFSGPPGQTSSLFSGPPGQPSSLFYGPPGQTSSLTSDTSPVNSGNAPRQRSMPLIGSMPLAATFENFQLLPHQD